MSSENQDIWENLALTSVGGMVTSTILLLITMPGGRLCRDSDATATVIINDLTAGEQPRPETEEGRVIRLSELELDYDAADRA